MVSIVAFQAVDRGSIPRWRKYTFCSILGQEKYVIYGLELLSVWASVV